MWLSDFDFDANPNINPATIHQLATGDWITKGQPLCLIGASGTDPRLCAAIVDRLTFGGTIIETGTDSYRLADTRNQT